MKNPISKKLLDYIKDNNLSYRYIQKKTGMYPTNIKELLHKENYGVTVALISRFISAFVEDETDIINSLFEEYHNTITWLKKQPENEYILTDTDILQFAVIMRYYFEDPDAFFWLIRIFYVLLDYVSQSEKTTVSLDPVTFSNAVERLYNSKDKHILEYIITSFFSKEDLSRPNINYYLYVKPIYPDFCDQNTLIEYLNNGESVTWTDVSFFLPNIRNAKGIDANKINKELGLGAYVINRIENLETKSFKIDEICKIDDYLGLDGLFLTSCLRAASISYMTTKVLDDFEKEISKGIKHPLVGDKKYRSILFEKAIVSFITLYRRLESWGGYTGLQKSFLDSFRTIYYSDQKIKLLMDNYGHFEFQSLNK